MNVYGPTEDKDDPVEDEFYTAQERKQVHIIGMHHKPANLIDLFWIPNHRIHK